MKRTDIRSIGKNNAERIAFKFSGGALACAAAGLSLVIMSALFRDSDVAFIGLLYASALFLVFSALYLAAYLHTRANNAIFRDRDEMMAAVRILESEASDLRSMRGGT